MRMHLQIYVSRRVSVSVGPLLAWTNDMRRLNDILKIACIRTTRRNRVAELPPITVIPTIGCMNKLLQFMARGSRGCEKRMGTLRNRRREVYE